MWIGIHDDIDGMVMDNSLKINVGDTLLLYTDGITEAQLRDDDTDNTESSKNNFDEIPEMFGEERLLNIFQRLSPGPTEEIMNGILKELESYICSDDVTMIILKRI